MNRENKRVWAALDIGTNSTLFLLAEVERDGRITPLEHDVRTNDLGRGTDAEGNLSPETIDLNLRMLHDFRQIAQAKGAGEIRIAATEGLRRAGNAHLLINRVQEELGLNVRIISGEEEARLTYSGVLSGYSDLCGKLFVADIGGGSCEIILGYSRELHYSKSLPLGAVSLDKKFIRSDPPGRSETEAMSEEARRAFETLPGSLKEEDCDLVICGGTASALAAADQGLSSYQPEKIGGHRLTMDRLLEFVHQFSTCTLRERRLIPGIGRRRAEIILPGTLLIIELLKFLGRREYITSERGLRYGLLVEKNL